MRDNDGGVHDPRIPVLAIVLGLIALVAVVLSIRSCPKDPERSAIDIALDQLQYEYSWEEGDLRGEHRNEAAAAHILLRANGIDVPYERLDTLPVTNAASILSEALNRMIDASTTCAIPVSASNLLFLPAPSLIWIRDGESARPVVFLYADEAEVMIADPDEGLEVMPFTAFHRMYDSAGRQAVYITERGYTAASG